MFGTMGTLSAMDYGIFFMSHSGSSVEHSLSTEKSCNELKSATFETERILGKMNIHTTNSILKFQQSEASWGEKYLHSCNISCVRTNYESNHCV